MKSTRKYLLLGLGVVLLLVLLSGCEVTVGPEPPVYGRIKICTHDSDIYGYVYIDDESTGYCIDGAEWSPGCYQCTEWITVTLDQRHYLEVWDSFEGITHSSSFIPTRDGQTIWIP